MSRTNNTLTALQHRQLQDFILKHIDPITLNRISKESFAKQAADDLGFPVVARNVQSAAKVVSEINPAFEWPRARNKKVRKDKGKPKRVAPLHFALVCDTLADLLDFAGDTKKADLLNQLARRYNPTNESE